MDIDFQSLVRQELIDAAAQEYQAACGRLDTARKALDAAASAVAAAESNVATIHRSIAAGRAADADAADSGLAEAKRAYDRAEKVFVAATAIREEQLAAQKNAKAAAWEPVMKSAAAEIIAAARDYEAACNAIAGAVERHQRAAAAAFAAYGSGAGAPFENGAELSPIRMDFFDARLAKFHIGLRPLAETELLWRDFK